MTGTDVRSLGRLRLSIEHRLIDYVIENSPKGDVIGGGDTDGGHDGTIIRKPPPSLGRLLYSLAISAMDAYPSSKDRRPDRTVHARSPTPHSLSERMRNEGGVENNDTDDNADGPVGLKSRRVWMNVCELPQDPTTLEYHGRFLSSKSLRSYYRTNFKCRVDVYGVWGDEGDGNGGSRTGGGIEGMMCAPYVLITSDEKVNVDKCLVHVEHRIREHEEKFGVSRSCGRRVLRGETPEGREQRPAKRKQRRQRSSEELLGSGLMTPR
jgi:hypothetical protein